MEKYETPSINLAKNRGPHLSEQILGFSLSIGRVLVIITEAIALGAFLFRFGLDRQIVDLHDKITQEQAIVNLLKKDEAIYRNLQDRLSLEKSISTQANNSLKLYQDIATMIPSDVSLINLSLSDSIVQMQGSVSSLVSLSSLVKKLKSYDSVASVSLDKLENKTLEGMLTFSLTITMKKALTRPLL